MKVSELIKMLEQYKSWAGDDGVVFEIADDDIELYLHKIHDGYNTDGRECELRLKVVK